MSTVTFTDVQSEEWIVPAGVHSIRVKARSGGGAAPSVGGMGGHYLEVTCRTIPGDTIYVTAASDQDSDSGNIEGDASQIILGYSRYGRILVNGGYTYDNSVGDAATASDPDPHGGFPYFFTQGEHSIGGVASNMLYASDILFYRGGLGVTGGGGGSGASSTGPGGDAVAGAGGASGGDGGGGGGVGESGSSPGGGAGSNGAVGAGGSVVFEYFTTHSEDEAVYFGRLQQGMELVIVLQCTDDYSTPEDPTYLPWVHVYRDTATPELITSKQMPAESRRVEDGIFRLSLFLDTLYSTEGRYLVLMKWLDSNGVAHVRTGSFHILPGGNPDGNVISLHSLARQDAMYLLMQCDSGRLIRKRNPR